MIIEELEKDIARLKDKVKALEAENLSLLIERSNHRSGIQSDAGRVCSVRIRRSGIP